MSPIKVLAIGDTHGDSQSIINIAMPQAARNECSIIIQVGDFGYWEHYDDGRKFLNAVSKHLVRRGMTMYWLDGNHENHPLLWETYKPDGPFGFCEIRPNLFYMPRGSVFRLGNVTCLAVGGAFSIDKESRICREMIAAGHKPFSVHLGDSSIKEWETLPVTHTMWWPTELLTDEEVNVAIENADGWETPVDIMFTHDCPTGIEIPGIHSRDKWKFPQTWENRDRLRTVFDAVQPKLLVHGHYHTAYTGRLPLKEEGWGCRVEGLANDGRQGFAIVLDLDMLFQAQD